MGKYIIEIENFPKWKNYSTQVMGDLILEHCKRSAHCTQVKDKCLLSLYFAVVALSTN